MIYTREVQVFLTTLLAVNKPLTPHKLSTYIGAFYRYSKCCGAPNPHFIVPSIENNSDAYYKVFSKTIYFCFNKIWAKQNSSSRSTLTKKIAFPEKPLPFPEQLFSKSLLRGFQKHFGELQKFEKTCVFFLANFNSFFFLQSTILFQTSKSLLKVDILSRELGGEMVATLLVEDGLSPGTNNLFNWKLVAIKAELKRKMSVWECGTL